MTVTNKILHEAVAGLYDTETKLYDEDDSVVFQVNCGGYYAYATLKLFTGFPDEEKPIQALGFSLVFSDQEGEALDLKKHDLTLIHAVCIELQHHLDWAIISPFVMPDKSIEVTLYRSVQTSASDVKLAAEQDLNSQLLGTLVQLQKECEYIAPVLQHFATSDEFDVSLIDLMLRPQDGPCS
jgi:hypothetical protein